MAADPLRTSKLTHRPVRPSLDQGARPVGNRSGPRFRGAGDTPCRPFIRRSRRLAIFAPVRRCLGGERRNPGTHPACRQSPDRWRVLHHAEDEIRRRDGAETLDLRPGDRGDRQRGWIDRVGGVSKQRLLDHERVSRSDIAQEIFGRPDGIVAWGPPGSPTRPRRSTAGIASPANGAS